MFQEALKRESKCWLYRLERKTTEKSREIMNYIQVGEEESRDIQEQPTGIQENTDSKVSLIRLLSLRTCSWYYKTLNYLSQVKSFEYSKISFR
jgi:hypothetical protein